MTKKKSFDTNLTEAEFRSRIVSVLRQSSRWWKPKQEAITRARVGRGKYECELCWAIWPPTLPPLPWNKRKRKNILADHIEPVVPVTGWVSYDNWIKRCFVWAEAFQAICWECHKRKTEEERKERNKNKQKKTKWKEKW